jgi:hypothetical protein
MKKVYIAEKKGIRFYVDKRDEDGKRVPKFNEDGVRLPGQFEQHVCTFDQFESAKKDGERVYKSVFIVTDKTPKEVADYIENVMVKNSECELEVDHVARTEPARAEALKALKKVEKEKEQLADENTKQKSKIDELEEQIAKLQANKGGNQQPQQGNQQKR